MRVSSTQTMTRYQKQLNDSYEAQTKLMEQSDGSRLHRPSDGSVDYSKYLRYMNTDTENTQYKGNVQTGISWMKTADSAMVNMTDIMTTLKEKTIQAANDTNGVSDVQAIGKEFLAKVQELVSLGNTQQGDRYLFSGQSDLTQPFTISSEKLDRGLTKTLDDNQISFFGAEGDDSGNTSQMLELKGSDDNTYYLSTRTGHIYSREFMDNGYKDVIAGGRSHVAAGDEVGAISGWSDDPPTQTVSMHFNANGVIRSDSTGSGKAWSETVTIDGEPVTLSFATIHQYVVEYNGDDKKISMVKRNGTTDPTADTVNATGQDLFGSDLFDNKNSGNQVNGSSSGTAALNDLLMVVAKMEAADIEWLSSDGITNSDAAHSKVLEAETTTAARQNVYDSVSTMLDNQRVTITQDISNVSDTDVAKLAMELMTMQTIYNMSLSVGSRILPQSLADYL